MADEDLIEKFQKVEDNFKKAVITIIEGKIKKCVIGRL